MSRRTDEAGPTRGAAPAQRVALLVDTGNLYHSARAQHQGRVDYQKLMEVVGGGRPIIRAIAYVLKAEDVDVSPFVEALSAVGFETRVKHLKRRPDGGPRGNWDVGIALDGIALADRVDVVALCSGNGDFVELLDALHGRGVRTEVYAFDDAASADLRHRAHGYRALGEDVLLAAPRASKG